MDWDIAMHNVQALKLSTAKPLEFLDTSLLEHVVLSLISGNPTVEPHRWPLTHATSQDCLLVKTMLNVVELPPQVFVKVVVLNTILSETGFLTCLAEEVLSPLIPQEHLQLRQDSSLMMEQKMGI